MKLEPRTAVKCGHSKIAILGCLLLQACVNTNSYAQSRVMAITPEITAITKQMRSASKAQETAPSPATATPKKINIFVYNNWNTAKKDVIAYVYFCDGTKTQSFVAASRIDQNKYVLFPVTLTSDKVWGTYFTWSEEVGSGAAKHASTAGHDCNDAAYNAAALVFEDFQLTIGAVPKGFEYPWTMVSHMEPGP